MHRCVKIVVLALFCVSCESKPAPSPSVSLPAQTQQAAVQPKARIGIVAIPAPPEKPKEPIAHQVAATIPGAQRILMAVASPQVDEIFGLAQTSKDTYGGTYFVFQPGRPEKQVEEVMGGMNLTDPVAPVWSPDGTTAYFVFDTDNYKRSRSAHDRGLCAWDRGGRKVTQILKDSIGGLAISADGTLAAFWDYTTGNKLTVYNLETKQVVRAWAGQVHSEDDLVLLDLAFAPDGKSLLARLYDPSDPVMQFDIASGKITRFAKDVQSFVTIGDSVYLLQFVPVPATNPENPHKLTKWTMGSVEPVTVVEDFLYEELTGSDGNPWLVARRARNYSAGLAIYDTKTGHIQTAGESCDTAIVTASGRVLYTFGGELVADAAVCSGPPLKQD